MKALDVSEIASVSGGDLLALSSALGHLGRAFGIGYGIGTMISDASPGSLDVAAGYEWNNLTA
jgi:hypothetical protein